MVDQLFQNTLGNKNYVQNPNAQEAKSRAPAVEVEGGGGFFSISSALPTELQETPRPPQSSLKITDIMSFYKEIGIQ